MYALLVIIHLLSGQVELHHSLVRGPQAAYECGKAMPLMLSLYQKGKFNDGPRPEEIKRVDAKCIRI